MLIGPTTAGALQRLRPTGGDVAVGGGPRVFPAPNEGGSFGDTLTEAIGRVDAAQKNADGQVEAFLAGDQENLADVMISMNEAKVHFQFMSEVRNRALETYQELMRMQV